MTNRRAPPGTTDRSDARPAARAEGLDPALPAWITQDLIEETIRVWQRYYQDSLTPEDAVAMMHGVCGLLKVLGRNDLSD